MSATLDWSHDLEPISRRIETQAERDGSVSLADVFSIFRTHLVLAAGAWSTRVLDAQDGERTSKSAIRVAGVEVASVAAEGYPGRRPLHQVSSKRKGCARRWASTPARRGVAATAWMTMRPVRARSCSVKTVEAVCQPDFPHLRPPGPPVRRREFIARVAHPGNTIT